MNKFTLISLCVFICTFTSVTSLVEEHAKEQACFPIAKTVVTDVQWLSSVKRLYNPLRSRLDLYRATRDMSGKPYSDITEPNLYYDSCLYFSVNPQTQIREGGGLNGKFHQYKYKGFDPYLEKFEYRSISSDRDDGYAVTCHTTKTDNSTYIVTACCANDNQMVWTVSSSLKSLPQQTVDIIHEHVSSLGFKKEYFTAFKYDACPENDKI